MLLDFVLHNAIRKLYMIVKSLARIDGALYCSWGSSFKAICEAGGHDFVYYLSSHNSKKRTNVLNVNILYPCCSH